MIRDDKTDSLDVNGIRQLLEERYHARQDNNYQRVSQVDRQLRYKHGVRAFDHPPIWTRRKEPPAAFLRRQAQKRQLELQDVYGPLMHPYVQVGRDIDPLLCPLSLPEIHNLLMQRCSCRTQGRYEKADALRFELWVHGIRLDDELYQWTADSEHEFVRREQRPPEAVVVYRQDDASQTLGEEDGRIQQRIEQLVSRRANLFTGGDTQRADYIAVELYETYKVGIDDDLRTWSVGAKFASSKSLWKPPSLPELAPENGQQAFPSILFADEEEMYDSETYRQSDSSLPMPNASVYIRVAELVLERIHRREEGKFLEADAIRRELWHTYVSIRCHSNGR